jgi:hypothetical protein
MQRQWDGTKNAQPPGILAPTLIRNVDYTTDDTKRMVSNEAISLLIGEEYNLED